MDQSLQHCSFSKGQVVHRHGDACVGIIYVRKGRISFFALSEEGREITVFRAESGQTCIISAACVLQGMSSGSMITAETEVELSILPAGILAQLMRDNLDVERVVYKQAAGQYDVVLKSLQRVLFFSLEKRLALFLLDECGQLDALTFSATHEQIARHIGSSREVVTRMLNQFSAQGMVSLGRGKIQVTDMEALHGIVSS